MKTDAIRLALGKIDRIYRKQHQEAIAELTVLEMENAKLRTMLAFCHAGAALYSDGGELQDNRTYPFIDYKRDSVQVIEGKMAQRLREEMQDEAH